MTTSSHVFLLQVMRLVFRIGQCDKKNEIII
jgi:hypothetical protein